MAPRGKPFKPGQSGNPGGRPKLLAEVQAYAREYSNEAIDGLVEIARSKKSPHAARVAAYNSILDRAWGRPAQSVDVTTNRKSTDEMSDAELMAIAAGAEEEEADATNETTH